MNISIDEERRMAILFLITIYPDITLTEIVKKLKQMFPEPVSGIYMSTGTVRKIISDLIDSKEVMETSSKFHKQRPIYSLSDDFVGINLKIEMTKVSDILSKVAAEYSKKTKTFPKKYLRYNTSRTLQSYRKFLKASLVWDIIKPSIDGMVSAALWRQIVTIENEQQFQELEEQFKKILKSILEVVLVDEDGPTVLPLVMTTTSDRDFITNLARLANTTSNDLKKK